MLLLLLSSGRFFFTSNKDVIPAMQQSTYSWLHYAGSVPGRLRFTFWYSVNIASVRLKFSGGGGRGADTFNTPILPVNNFCLYPPPVLRCFWKDPLMAPHNPMSSIFHCYSLAIHHPSPLKNFDHAPTH